MRAILQASTNTASTPNSVWPSHRICVANWTRRSMGRRSTSHRGSPERCGSGRSERSKPWLWRPNNRWCPTKRCWNTSSCSIPVQAARVEMDKAGRVRIPERMLRIADPGTSVVAGVKDHGAGSGAAGKRCGNRNSPSRPRSCFGSSSHAEAAGGGCWLSMKPLNAHGHHDSNPERGTDHFGHARMLAHASGRVPRTRACVNSISCTGEARGGPPDAVYAGTGISSWRVMDDPDMADELSSDCSSSVRSSAAAHGRPSVTTWLRRWMGDPRRAAARPRRPVHPQVPEGRIPLPGSWRAPTARHGLLLSRGA